MVQSFLSTLSTSLVLGSPLALAVIIGLADPAHADLNICNKTTKILSTAIAYHNSGKNTWTSEGWWSVKPGECAVPVEGDLGNRYYYIHAHTDDGTIIWDGEHEFYVTTEAFTIVDAESGDEGDRIEGFFEVDTGDSKDFTQNLTPPK
jgi:uncharacterized membrane protein